MDAVRSFLLAGSAIQALLAEPLVGVHVAVAPPKAPRPYVVLHGLDGTTTYHHGGASNRERLAIQAESWADTRAQAVALDQAVRDRLSGYRGALTSARWCQGAFITGGPRGPEATDLQDGGSDPAFSVQTDYGVWAQPRAA